MLKLGGKVIRIHTEEPSGVSMVLSVSTNDRLPLILRVSKAYLLEDERMPEGFAHYLVPADKQGFLTDLPPGARYTVLPNDYDYLGDGDVIRLTPDRSLIKVLFRASSPHNSILVTEQCNHYCLMCSQPPKNIDDSWILGDIETMIPLIPRGTKEIGFTGGEPTLYGDRFLDVLRLTKSYLPQTSIHILSNGRSFKDFSFASRYAGIDHPDMMVGIPIYSDDPVLHDYIVQAPGAFDETLQGVLNLKELGQKVEIRVVLHKQSIKRIKELSEFLTRNLLFVDHVALMGLEMMGFTRANLDSLWIDPYDYKDDLSKAVDTLVKYGMNVSIYNHQLCVVNPDVHPYCRQSISDWKNEYLPQCESCAKKCACGGFFSSGIQFGFSKHIEPFC
ncbi:MAG: His-Xaa-Ser system radical SAM maturase HxsC [Halothiobacillus sp.]|jgi:His-Xaa-Ser system radical SAM maturase HxsC|nr:His-Xaa-Ser system radical SAM maturase HxsC [Halothiobacillus sp.]